MVADTPLSEVDGERGRLVIAGHDVERLGGHALLRGALPGAVGGRPGRHLGSELREALGRERVWAFEQIEGARDGRSHRRGRDGRAPRVRSRSFRPTGHPGTSAVRLTAACAVFAAAWWRLREGRAPLRPDPAAGHAEDLVRMLRGKATAHARRRRSRPTW